MTFLNSDNVKVFPSAFRAYANNPTSKLTVEENLISIPGVHGKQSFVESIDNTNKIITLYIAGYKFIISGFTYAELLAKGRYACINLIQATTTNVGMVLAKWGATTPGQLDEGNEFKALWFDSAMTTYSLDLSDVSNAFPIDTASIASNNTTSATPITGNLVDGTADCSIAQLYKSTTSCLANSVAAEGAVALGNNNTINSGNDYSFTAGKNNVISAHSSGSYTSIAIGEELLVQPNSIVLGRYNASYTDIGVSKNPIIIGCGNSNGRKNALIITNDEEVVTCKFLTETVNIKDNVIVDSANKAIKINPATEVISSNNSNNNLYFNSNILPKNTSIINLGSTDHKYKEAYIETANLDKAKIASYLGIDDDSVVITKDVYSTYDQVYIHTRTGNIKTRGDLEVKAIRATGDVAVGGASFKFTSSGAITCASISASGEVAANSFNATSDIRKKENIVDYTPEKSILDLQVKKFDFIDGPKNQIGCIAQDLREICPEIVNEDADGYLSIQESKLVYLLLDEVKKLKEEIKELKK